MLMTDNRRLEQGGAMSLAVRLWQQQYIRGAAYFIAILVHHRHGDEGCWYVAVSRRQPRQMQPSVPSALLAEAA
jgi:hypothetical protein